MTTQISDPSVLANNVGIKIVPNSLAYTEGFGEQEILVQSAGGGQLEQVFSDNVESNLSMVKFDMRSTVENIKLVRGWKANKNNNTLTITATVDGESLKRTFTNCALTADYEVGLSSDGVINVEFHGDKATT